MVEKSMRYFGTNGLRLFSLSIVIGLASVIFDQSSLMRQGSHSPSYPFAEFLMLFVAMLFVLAIFGLAGNRKRKLFPLVSLVAILFSILGSISFFSLLFH